MAKKNGKKETERDRLALLAAVIPDDQAIEDTFEALTKDRSSFSDYAIAMIGASLLEKSLEVAIRAYLRPLNETEGKRLFNFEANGPLAEFSARIKMAHAVGVYGPKTMGDLNLIREIRNLFAHSTHEMTFRLKDIVTLCDRLNVTNTVSLLEISPTAPARDRFIHAAKALASRLRSRIAQPLSDTGNQLLVITRKMERERFLP